MRSQRNQLHTTRHHRGQSCTGGQLGQQTLTLSGVSVQVRHERRQRRIRNVKVSGQTGAAFNALTGTISHVEAVAQALTLNLHHSPIAGTKLSGHLSQTGSASSHQTVNLLRTHLLTSGGEHLLTPLVISSNHSQLGTFGSEQLSLRIEVVLHGAVQIQVILSQVRKACNRILHTVHTVVINRVRRHLHRRATYLLLTHNRQQRMHVRRLRGGHLRRNRDTINQNLNSANQTGLHTQAGAEHRLQHVGGGGLTVRTGDRITVSSRERR